MFEQHFVNRAIGVDCQYYFPTRKKFKQIRIAENAEDVEIVPVLANLAVRKDRRGRGYAKELLRTAEGYVKVIQFLNISHKAGILIY